MSKPREILIGDIPDILKILKEKEENERFNRLQKKFSLFQADLILSLSKRNPDLFLQEPEAIYTKLSELEKKAPIVVIIEKNLSEIFNNILKNDFLEDETKLEALKKHHRFSESQANLMLKLYKEEKDQKLFTEALTETNKKEKLEDLYKKLSDLEKKEQPKQTIQQHKDELEPITEIINKIKADLTTNKWATQDAQGKLHPLKANKHILKMIPLINSFEDCKANPQLPDRSKIAQKAIGNILVLGRDAASGLTKKEIKSTQKGEAPRISFFDFIKGRDNKTIAFYDKFRAGGEYDFYEKKDKQLFNLGKVKPK